MSYTDQPDNAVKAPDTADNLSLSGELSYAFASALRDVDHGVSKFIGADATTTQAVLPKANIVSDATGKPTSILVPGSKIPA